MKDYYKKKANEAREAMRVALDAGDYTEAQKQEREFKNYTDAAEGLDE